MNRIIIIALILSFILTSCKTDDRKGVLPVSTELQQENSDTGATVPETTPVPHDANEQASGSNANEQSSGSNINEQTSSSNDEAESKDQTESGEQIEPEQGNQQAGNDQNPEGGKEPVNPEKNENNDYIGPKIDTVTAQMQNAAFWMNLYEHAEQTILTPDAINKYNEDNFRQLPFLFDPLNQPSTIPGDEVRQWISQLSAVPKSTRYDWGGKAYTNADYDRMKQNLNLDVIPAKADVQYGLTVKRTLMRTWPSTKGSFSKPSEQKIDYFVETAVYPAEPVSIYHTSADGKWFYAGIYHYKAWIPVEDVALCTRDELIEYIAQEDSLVIRGAKHYTPDAEDKRISKLQLDMGISFPIQDENLNGYTVRYPVRDEFGKTEYIPLELQKSTEVARGHADYTTATTLDQAFKFIGETYGWGGMNDARDCTSFLVDIYRTFGILLPRNSDQQEQLQGAISLKGMERKERLQILENLRPGSALYMPGHAMMYLGEYKGKHYMIHDVTAVYEKEQDGSLKPVTLYQVAVTPLEVYNYKGTEFIMLLTTAVEID